MLSSASE